MKNSEQKVALEKEKVLLQTKVKQLEKNSM